MIWLFCIAASVYAANTIRTYIPEVTNTTSNSYPGQAITILAGSVLVNLGNDDELVGDFLSGEYYDSAHGVFSFDAVPQRVSISSSSYTCTWDTATHDGYELEGYAWNDEFGAVDFSAMHFCIPRDENSSLDAYIGWYASSPLIWFQNFARISFDAYVDRDSEHLSDARYTRVEWVASSSNYSDVDSQSQSEVRVVWNITKSSLKKQVLQNVYTATKNVSSNNSILSISSSSLWSSTWNSGWGTLLKDDTVLYYANLTGWTVRLNSDQNIASNIEWNKTLVVEGGNIYIMGNIRNTDNDNAMLGLIAISKDGQGGNIYIDPSVTDIHANMYADRSVISYDGTELNGDTPDSILRNQLFIFGSVFSENTLGGADDTPITCPFYENQSCSESLAKKYDFNYLRRYILVSEVVPDPLTGEMVLSGVMSPDNGWRESYMWDNNNTNTQAQKPGYRVYPFVIEYNARIQQNPPPFF